MLETTLETVPFRSIAVGNHFVHKGQVYIKTARCKMVVPNIAVGFAMLNKNPLVNTIDDSIGAKVPVPKRVGRPVKNTNVPFISLEAVAPI